MPQHANARYHISQTIKVTTTKFQQASITTNQHTHTAPTDNDLLKQSLSKIPNNDNRNRWKIWISRCLIGETQSALVARDTVIAHVHAHTQTHSWRLSTSPLSTNAIDYILVSAATTGTRVIVLTTSNDTHTHTYSTSLAITRRVAMQTE